MGKRIYVTKKKASRRKTFDPIMLRGKERIPTKIRCMVCYRQGVRLRDAVLQEGGPIMGHKSYWLCKKHLEEQPFKK